jgi:lipopolysaccharide/colanic/teichoic acid biosynthesis glycosyltransferase
MAERSVSIIQLIKFNFERHFLRWFLIIGDLGGAAFIGWQVRKFLVSLPATNFILQVWLLAVAFMWLITYDIDKNFRFDSYLTYTRILKIASWAGVAYLLYFVITREFYSLTFLFWVTVLWLAWTTSLRWLLDRFSPPLRGFALEAVPDVIRSHHKVIWKISNDPQQINLAEFDFLVIDFSKRYSTESQKLFTHAHMAGLPIMSIPQLIEHLTGKISIESFNDAWIESNFYIDPFYLRLKRIIDIVLTLLLAPLILFLGAIIALLIAIFMGKPIFFWQERVGLDDKPFKMVKFRTMVVDADKLGAASTGKEDDRVTKLGFWLRKLRLDELPQFYNVLRGDMSIIGPRPENAPLTENFMKNIPLFQVRHWLRPGITGWAQVMHGYATSQDEMMEKVRHDMFYLKNLSLWLDLIILFRTIMIVLTGFGSR